MDLHFLRACDEAREVFGVDDFNLEDFYNEEGEVEDVLDEEEEILDEEDREDSILRVLILINNHAVNLLLF